VKTILLAATVAGVLATGTMHARSGAEVVKAKGCMNCHELDKKKVGPAYKEVAAKYKSDKGAEDSLIAKLKAAKDHPKIAASDAELKAAVAYVLSLK
jgi:cytochrome c